MAKETLYLAGPYSHPTAVMRDHRFRELNRAAAHLVAQGYRVFSPISHSHPIARYMTHEQLADHKLWMDQDLYWLDYCDALVILTMEGWRESVGVGDEDQHALIELIPIWHMDPETYEITVYKEGV